MVFYLWVEGGFLDLISDVYRLASLYIQAMLQYQLKEKKKSKVAQLCPTLCNPMDYSLPGSSIHGIFQARVLEWVAISFSRVSS